MIANYRLFDYSYFGIINFLIEPLLVCESDKKGFDFVLKIFVSIASEVGFNLSAVLWFDSNVKF
jgi:hypothetical protein